MNNKPNLITLDYFMNVEDIEGLADSNHFRFILAYLQTVNRFL